jgi:hypothetical protein
MKRWLLLLLLAMPAQAVELKSLAVEFRKYPGKTYFAELPDDQIREQISVVFDTHLGSCFYWWNEIHGSSTDAQFRWIGWHHMLSCRLNSVDFFYEHHSQHALDRVQYGGLHFPVSDALGVRWKIYGP